jgi:hypothetical protein|tara:strand:+ start:496 stop:765 length:270 start_codon:yes stop_codon:yes gene_type:complete
METETKKAEKETIAPLYDECSEAITDMFRCFGKANHYLDTDIYPTLNREKITSIFAELQALATKINEPLVALLHKEIKHDIWSNEISNV